MSTPNFQPPQAAPPHYYIPPPSPPQYVLPQNMPQTPQQSSPQPLHSTYHTPVTQTVPAPNARPTPSSAGTSLPYLSASHYQSTLTKPAQGPEDATLLYGLLGMVLGFLLGPICFFFLCCQKTLGMRGKRKTFFVWGTVIGLILLIAAAVSAWFVFFRDEGFDLE